MRRRRLRRQQRPPTVASPGQRTTCRRESQECRAPPVLLQWPAVTHTPTPVLLDGGGKIHRPATRLSRLRPVWRKLPLSEWVRIHFRRACGDGFLRILEAQGLDPAFSSLDAQREACEAYIKSQ